MFCQKNRKQKLSIIFYGNRRDNNKILTNQIAPIRLLDSKIESVPQSGPFQRFETTATENTSLRFSLIPLIDERKCLYVLNNGHSLKIILPSSSSSAINFILYKFKMFSSFSLSKITLLYYNDFQFQFLIVFYYVFL